MAVSLSGVAVKVRIPAGEAPPDPFNSVDLVTVTFESE